MLRVFLVCDREDEKFPLSPHAVGNRYNKLDRCRTPIYLQKKLQRKIQLFQLGPPRPLNVDYDFYNMVNIRHIEPCTLKDQLPAD